MSNLGWPEIPEILVDFKPNDSGGLEANIIVDLGVLGKWELGEVRIDEPDPVAEEREKAETVAEIQVAFNRLLMRVAASALVKQDKGCFPVITWYAVALKEKHGMEKANEMIDKDIAELLDYRKDGVGFHEL